jgi:hypothetical protein
MINKDGKTSIIISPFSSVQPNGVKNAKNYPWWNELIYLLIQNDFHTIQINPGNEPILKINSIRFGLNMTELWKLLYNTDMWISVDNFFHHFAHYHKKYGFVLWGKSDPNLFGYPENINILKDRKYLRPNQFLWWREEPYSEDVFVKPEEVMNIILQQRKNIGRTIRTENKFI